MKVWLVSTILLKFELSKLIDLVIQQCLCGRGVTPGLENIELINVCIYFTKLEHILQRKQTL